MFERDQVGPGVLRGRLGGTRREFFESLRDDPAVRSGLNAFLRDAPFAAFSWETPPLTPGGADRPAEMVLVDNPWLARAVADSAPFEGALGDAPIGTFPNLGGDALLIVPNPRVAPKATHLAEFVRQARPEISDALWSAVGKAVCARLASGLWPFWVSTAGMGVSWLHVRLDNQPKYYRHRPYARSDA